MRRRRRRPILILVILLLIVFVLFRVNQKKSSPAPEPVNIPEVTENTPADTEPVETIKIPVTNFTLPSGEYEKSLLSDSRNRKYLLYVPPSYQTTKEIPLVLFFHGGGGNMNHSARNYDLKEKAREAGFAVVFMQGTSGLPNDFLATWNAGACCGYARDNRIDDVEYTKQVILDIEEDFNINKKKIFATGMSNGGMMSHRLACEMASTFAAVASVAGTDNTTLCSPSRPIPVLHIHAKDDTHVLFEGGAGEGAFRDLSKVTDFVSVPKTITNWKERNDIDTEPKRILEKPGAYCDLYSGSSNSAPVQLCVTENGGHSWPGSSKESNSGAVPSTAIKANDVIWDFFVNK